MSNTVREGNIFIISDVKMEDGTVLSLDKKIRLGKVVFVSKVTRKMIGIVISSDIFDKIPNEISHIHFGNEIFYTGNQFLRSGDWKIIGNQLVSKEEENLTVRLVGSSLRRLDIDLGIVPYQDRKKYKKQYIKGLELLYENLNEL